MAVRSISRSLQGSFWGQRAQVLRAFGAHQPPSLPCTFPKWQVRLETQASCEVTLAHVIQGTMVTTSCQGAGCGLRQDFSNCSQMYSPGSAELQEIISIAVPTGKIIMGRPPVYSRLSAQAAPLLILISVFYISFIEVFISVLSVRPAAVLP